jgi:hypothetical protein
MEKIATEERMEGRREGTLETLFGLVQDGIITISEAAKRADMTETIFVENMEKFNSVRTDLSSIYAQ